MHNRRFGALLIGGWLVGTAIIWFITAQTLLTADRVLTTPPAAVQKGLADMGSGTAASLLRYQATEVNRRLVETWEILQIGMGCALFVTSFLTVHRSKTTLGASILLTALAAAGALYVTPAMNELGRFLDFLPLSAAPQERQTFGQLQLWHKVLDILKLLSALVVSGRLLFDFYEFRDRFGAPIRTHGRSRRRRSAQHARNTPAPAGAERSSSGPAETGQRSA
jgi:hypothetical protein